MSRVDNIVSEEGGSADRIRPLRRSNTSSLQDDHLWNKAVKLLNEDERQQIEFSQADKLSALGDILKAVEQKHGASVQKQRQLRIGRKQPINLHDAFSRIANSIDKFKQVGDTLVQYDPTHAALPWAAVRFVLVAVVSENQIYSSTVEGIELVSRLITQYATVETLYLKGSSELETQLTKALVRLYASILVFLARAKKFFSRRTAERMVRGIFQTEEISVGKYLSKISEDERAVDSIANLINAKYLREITDFMGNKFGAVLDNILRLGEQIDKVHISHDQPTQDRSVITASPSVGQQEVLHWLDATFTHDEYRSALNARVKGTCSWIIERPIFQKWLDDEQDTTLTKFLWVHGYPGFGKTVLAASLIEHLRRLRPVAFFFCFYSDQKKRQPLQICRSWLAQAVMSNEEAFYIAKDGFAEKKSDHALEMDLWALFRKINMRLRGQIFVVDGFDECTKSEATLARNHDALDARERFCQNLGSQL